MGDHIITRDRNLLHPAGISSRRNSGVILAFLVDQDVRTFDPFRVVEGDCKGFL